MLAKRIVPCLDIKDGKTVKGINFVNFRDAGDRSNWGTIQPGGADELVYLDITLRTKDVRHLRNWSRRLRPISAFLSRLAAASTS